MLLINYNVEAQNIELLNEENKEYHIIDSLLYNINNIKPAKEIFNKLSPTNKSVIFQIQFFYLEGNIDSVYLYLSNLITEELTSSRNKGSITNTVLTNDEISNNYFIDDARILSFLKKCYMDFLNPNDWQRILIDLYIDDQAIRGRYLRCIKHNKIFFEKSNDCDTNLFSIFENEEFERVKKLIKNDTFPFAEISKSHAYFYILNTLFIHIDDINYRKKILIPFLKDKNIKNEYPLNYILNQIIRTEWLDHKYKIGDDVFKKRVEELKKEYNLPDYQYFLL